MKNLSVRVKLLLATVPSLIILIIFTFFFLNKMNSLYNDAEEVYYHRLYTINSNLINADRDFYQALQASTKEYNMENAHSPGLTDELKQQIIDDFNENKQQVFDNTQAAFEAAKADKDLWTGVKSESGQTFEEVAAEFDAAFSAWEGTYDVGNDTLTEDQFIAHSESFSTARDYLNTLQEITEAWAEKENAQIRANLKHTEMMSIIAFIIVAVGMSILSAYVMRMIANGIRDTYGKLVNLSHYDLSQEYLVVDSTDEIGKMKQAFNDTQKALREIVGTLQNTSGGLSNASDHMTQGTRSTSQGVDDVSSAATELANASTNMAQDVADISMNVGTLSEIMTESSEAAKNLAEASTQIGAVTKDGNQIVDELSRINEKSLDEFNAIFSSIDDIGAASERIAQASELISGIANQTNLLSLNASIEAARAGDAGKGFAVVADGIRKLSDESKENVDTINAIIDELSNVTASASEKSEAVKEYVKKQNEAVSQTKESFTAIVSAVEVAENAIGKLEGCVSDLDKKTKEISDSVSNLSSLSQENAATSEELSATSDTVATSVEGLREQQSNVDMSSKGLSEIVGRFKVDASLEDADTQE